MTQRESLRKELRDIATREGLREHGIAPRLYVDSRVLKALNKSWQAGYAAALPKWIAVEEKLPEVGGTYLVRAKFAEPFNYCTDFGHFFLLESGPEWMTSGSKPQDVSHWMPLPEPPRALAAGTQTAKE